MNSSHKTPQNNKKAHKDQSGQVFTGVISTTRKGAGYIDDPDPKKDSIYIEEGTLNTALNRDRVEFSLSEKNIRGVKTTVGTIKKIVSRAKETFVGIVSFESDSDTSKGHLSGGKSCIVIPDDKKMYVSISITANEVKRLEEEGKGLKKDDKIFVRILPWNDPKKLPEGKVLKVLGKKGVNNVEMESIVLERGFEVGFPAAVEKEAEHIGQTEKNITVEEIAKRRDIRDTLTFTIDPFDAKDFDDAISFKALSPEKRKELNINGPAYEIGVHIADVSHYVREGSALDKEAV